MQNQTLRLAREKKGYSLNQIAARTGVKLRTLELVDAGRFAELPSGLYGRAAIRAYATAVGLDADEVLAECASLIPVPEDPLDGLARVRGLARRASTRQPEPGASHPHRAPAPAAAAGIIAMRSVEQEELWRRFAASMFDGVLLVGIDVALVWLTARACGTSMATALRAGAPGIGLLFVLIGLLYFVLLGGVRNATFGARLMGLPDGEPADGALDVHAVFDRARRCVAGETSIFVEWLVQSGNGERCLRAIRFRRA